MDNAINSNDGRSKPRPGIAEQQQTIINAAVDLFIEYGSRAVSISQICQQAEVSRPTFYRCFPDKEALIAEIYQESVNTPVEIILIQGLSEKRDKHWMSNALDEMLESIFAKARYAQLVYMESNDPNSPAFAIVNEGYDKAAKVLSAWMKEHGHSTVSTIYLKSLMSAYQWIIYDAIRKGLTPKNKQQAKEAVAQLTQANFRLLLQPKG